MITKVNETNQKIFEDVTDVNFKDIKYGTKCIIDNKPVEIADVFLSPFKQTIFIQFMVFTGTYRMTNIVDNKPPTVVENVIHYIIPIKEFRTKMQWKEIKILNS